MREVEGGKKGFGVRANRMHYVCAWKGQWVSKDQYASSLSHTGSSWVSWLDDMVALKTATLEER